MTGKLVYGDEVFAIVGAAIEVHKQLGSGFLEAVYQEAMEIELSARDIPFRAQQEMVIQYKEHILNKYYVADFVCYDKIVVELKAVDRLSGKAQSQVINYLSFAAVDDQNGMVSIFKNLYRTPTRSRSHWNQTAPFCMASDNARHYSIALYPSNPYHQA